MSDRRDALKIIGAIGSTCAFPYSADELYGQHAHGGDTAAAALPSKPTFFTGPEFETISQLAERILPGAGEAGTPMYIDYVVNSSETWKTVFRDGLARLDQKARKFGGKRFAELTEAQQIALLTPLCEAADKLTGSAKGPADARFFKAVKGMTADGFWTSKAGLVDTLRYKGNTVLGAFPSCEHEH